MGDYKRSIITYIKNMFISTKNKPMENLEHERILLDKYCCQAENY